MPNFARHSECWILPDRQLLITIPFGVFSVKGYLQEGVLSVMRIHVYAKMKFCIFSEKYKNLVKLKEYIDIQLTSPPCSPHTKKIEIKIYVDHE